MLETVGRGAVGVFVGFHEEPGNADGYGGTGQDGHETAVAARAVAQAARLLNRMGRVEDDWAPGLGHDRQGPHIVDQGVIAETDAAFGQKHIRVAGVGHFAGDIGHVLGRQKLPLFDVDDTARLGRGDQEICLAAEEGRDLKHVDHAGEQRALFALMNVGQNGQAPAFADFGEDRKRSLNPHAAGRRTRAAVSLIEGGFIDEPDPGLFRNFLQSVAGFDGVVAAFHLAGTGDQREGQSLPKVTLPTAT